MGRFNAFVMRRVKKFVFFGFVNSRENRENTLEAKKRSARAPLCQMIFKQ